MIPSPIFGPQYQSDDFGTIDLSVDNQDLGNADINGLHTYVFDRIATGHQRFLYGGYLERRALYQSDLFRAQEIRDIHLGIDIWGPAGTPVHAPIPGRIHSFAYNDNGLDYGHTLILEHDQYYTLYGHLSANLVSIWERGAPVDAGQQIATLGDYAENGGWPPHLHFQKILDLERRHGDYPGVCSVARHAHFSKNCPDPSDLLHFTFI